MTNFSSDNQTNSICAPAPLFDHGNSLFNFAYADDWDDIDHLNKYIQTLQPCIYDDYIETARGMMGENHREMIRHLLDYRLRKHARYNLPDHRLKLISAAVRQRARALL